MVESLNGNVGLKFLHWKKKKDRIVLFNYYFFHLDLLGASKLWAILKRGKILLCSISLIKDLKRRRRLLQRRQHFTIKDLWVSWPVGLLTTSLQLQ